MNIVTIFLLCFGGTWLVGLAIWWSWIMADHRGWKRGFKAAEDIWKTGFYELSEQMKNRN